MVRPGTAVASPIPQQQQPPQQPVPSGPRPAVPKPLPNNKFVCGVKGTQRERREVDSEIIGMHFTHYLIYMIELSLRLTFSHRS